MSKRFRECSLEQVYLLPPSLEEWLPEDHLARFVAEVCEEMNLREILASYEGDGRGLAAYHPVMMVRVLVYGYCTGRRSARQIEKATKEDVAFRYLSANQQPDHDTIAAFRRRHLKALGELFVQVLALCRAAGLVKMGTVAIDGTKMKANASRGKTQRYREWADEERDLVELVRRILEEAERVDQEEDEKYGQGRKETDLPAELATAEQRRKKIRELKERMEEEARERARAADQEREESGGKHRTEAAKKRYERAHREREEANPLCNLTDPDSRVMREAASGGWLQGYNGQMAVDGAAQVIVAAEVTNEAADRGQLASMVDAVRREMGEAPRVVVADAGYFSTEAFEDKRLRGCDVLVSPDGRRTRPEAPRPHNYSRHPQAVRMRERLASEEGRRLYALRQALVEPVFGQIKEARGIRRFLLRGLDAVRAEWRLIAATHNLLKLFRHGQPARA